VILICLWCQGQKPPAFLREIEPYGDVVVPTICVLHSEELTARLRAVASELRAQAEGEAGA